MKIDVCIGDICCWLLQLELFDLDFLLASLRCILLTILVETQSNSYMPF